MGITNYLLNIHNKLLNIFGKSVVVAVTPVVVGDVVAALVEDVIETTHIVF